MPTDPNDLSNQIADAAAGPRSVSGDQGSVTQQSVQDLIAADQYLAAKAAARRRGLGIRQFKLRPPGAGDVDLGCR